MAGSKICLNCGAENPSSNRFCEDCGYDMNKTPAAPAAPVAALFCPNGHSIGKTGLSMGFCDVCGEKLVSEMPVVELEEPRLDPESINPLLPTSTHGKKCSSCGMINPESGVFCEECGHALGEEPLPPILEETPTYSSKGTLPDIPDIMRPMTNDDMKR